MARVACRACGINERVYWEGACRCPSCGSLEGRVALDVEELFHGPVVRRSLDEADEGIAAAA